MGNFKQFLQEKESEYQKFFKKKLADHGVESPEDLSDEDKKKFFDEIDNEWDAKNESGDDDLNEAVKKLKGTDIEIRTSGSGDKTDSKFYYGGTLAVTVVASDTGIDSVKVADSTALGELLNDLHTVR